MAIPQGWAGLGFTSGRRTYLGNRQVGGVPHSDHLDGTAADFTASIPQLRAQFGPNVKILNEGDHRHVSGLSNVPYYGRTGTAGLVDGVDTSAPKRTAMPRKPTTLRDVTQGNLPPNPLLKPDVPQLMDSAPVSSAIDMGQLRQMAQTPQFKKGGVLGSGLTLGDIVANGLVGFAAGMGNSAPAQSLNDARARMQQQSFDREQWAAKLESDRQERLAKAAAPFQHTNSAGDVIEIHPQSGAQRVIYADPNGKQQYERVTNPATGAVELVNNGSVPRPNDQHIQMLLQSGDKANFDAKFGPGMADYYMRAFGGR